MSDEPASSADADVDDFSDVAPNGEEGDAQTDSPIAVPISHELFDSVTSAAGVDLDHVAAASADPIDAITLDLLSAQVQSRGLRFDGSTTLREVLVAVRSGKHVLLQGPPGTGKTTLAEALAEAAQAAKVTSGSVQLTGSSDWTPSDTVGSYRQDRNKDLVFVKGQILDAIANDHWVIIDELNRADIDRAMGPLFSVLSGQSTTIRFEEERNGEFRRVAIVPFGNPIDGHANYEVSSGWRIIATMNTKDLDLLYEVSQAFLRRFAIIDVPCPDRSAHEELLGAHATGDVAVDSVVRRLASLPDFELGPAITLDAARYVSAQWHLDQSARPAPSVIADQVFRIFVRPQLSGLEQRKQDAIRKYLGQAEAPPETAEAEPQTGEDD
jgi:MoxR-like ATPase